MILSPTIDSCHLSPYPFANLEGIPESLRALNSWLTWRFVDEGTGKLKKRPYDPRTGLPASINRQTSMVRLPFLTRGNPFGFDGVGIVLRKELGLVVVDLDHAVDPVTAVIAHWATEIVEHFKGLGYIELSPSKTGIHIIGRATLPVGYRRKGGVEMLHDRRFVTVTGFPVPGVESVVL